PEARGGRSRDVHGPACVLRSRRRADLPAAFSPGRAGPGDEVRPRPALEALLPARAHGEGGAAPREAAARSGHRRGRRGQRVAALRVLLAPPASGARAVLACLPSASATLRSTAGRVV